MKTIAHAGAHAGTRLGVLNNSDIAVAVVIAGNRAVQYPEGFDLTAVKADNFVAVFCFSSVSVVHSFICFELLCVKCCNHRSIAPMNEH